MRTGFPFATAALVLSASGAVAQAVPAQQPELAGDLGVVEADGLRFRDLNRNGSLDGYEDWRRAPERRAADLVARMTLAEKVGQLFHGTLYPLPAGAGEAGYIPEMVRDQVSERKVTTLLSRLSTDPRSMAAANNSVQRVAAQGRLGIPATLSTDPRSHFQEAIAMDSAAAGFSQWPETLGLAAIGDPDLVRRFGDMVRQEYRAVGLQVALSPQADLATDPRWARINGTFGDDPQLAAAMTGAYVAGFQHGTDGVAPDGVATVVKHWVGYGAAKDGWDAHNYYGRFATMNADAFPMHVAPFAAAFAAGAAGVMPSYAILEDFVLDGQPVEQTGAGFSKVLLRDELRDRQGFDGIILSDWGITNDCGRECREGYAPGTALTFAGSSKAWGMENVAKADRFVRALDAGIDQFGGTVDVEVLLQAVRDGSVSEARIDRSAARILAQTFRLGLFENPYVDEDEAVRIAGNPEFLEAAHRAQAMAIVPLEDQGRILPLDPMRHPRVFLRGSDAGPWRDAGFVVTGRPDDADFAVVRVHAPYQTLHPNYPFGARQSEGDLGFPEDHPDLALIRATATQVPTIAVVYLDRPAILGNVRDSAQALLVEFGASDAGLVDALTGKIEMVGRLPFELPSSMEAVERQRPDLPHDSAAPLYEFGYRRER